MSKTKSMRPLQEGELEALAEFRYQLRRFLRYMEEESREAGINPQQYQLILAVRGLPKDMSPTISTLAERMQLNHNSMVELVDRCEERGLLKRSRASADRRQVTLSVTTNGEAVLRRLASAARQELRSRSPMLMESMEQLMQEARNARNNSNRQTTGSTRKAGA